MRYCRFPDIKLAAFQMDVECIGKAVSMDCGALGFYQGVIDSFNLEEQSITIKNAVQNGKTVDRPKLTIR